MPRERRYTEVQLLGDPPVDELALPSRPYMLMRCAPMSAGAAPAGPTMAMRTAAVAPAAPLIDPMAYVGKGTHTQGKVDVR